MSRTIPRIPRLFFALAVCGSLGFGATQAFAGEAQTCQWNPPTYLGTCISAAQCDADCEFVRGGPAQGACTVRGCCVCFAA